MENISEDEVYLCIVGLIVFCAILFPYIDTDIETNDAIVLDAIITIGLFTIIVLGAIGLYYFA